MFGRTPKEESKKLDIVMNQILDDMIAYSPSSAEYPDLMKKLKKVHAMRTSNKMSWPSPDTIALVAANIVGILIIVGYERGNAVTSKAFGMLHKTK